MGAVGGERLSARHQERLLVLHVDRVRREGLEQWLAGERVEDDFAPTRCHLPLHGKRQAVRAAIRAAISSAFSAVTPKLTRFEATGEGAASLARGSAAVEARRESESSMFFCTEREIMWEIRRSSGGRRMRLCASSG